MRKLVLMSHGQCFGLREKRFNGWMDVDLTRRGIDEAVRAAEYMVRDGLTFDMAFTSLLKRAVRTLWLAMSRMDLVWIPVFKDWHLNDRHYGELQGLSMADAQEQFGEDYVARWSQAYAEAPPPLDPIDDRYPGRDIRYKMLSEQELPRGEAFKDTVARTLPYFNTVIAPTIKGRKRVLIVTHAETMRALVKCLERISDDRIVKLKLPRCVPLVYELDLNMRVKDRYYLGEEEALQELQE